MQPSATILAFVLTLGGLLGLLGVAAASSDTKSTGDLTPTELYARVMQRAAAYEFFQTKTHTVVTNVADGSVVRDEKKEEWCAATASRYFDKLVHIDFIPFPYPVNGIVQIRVEMLGTTNLDGAQVFRLLVTDPRSELSDITIWQELLVDTRTLMPLEIITYRERAYTFGDAVLLDRKVTTAFGLTNDYPFD